MESKKTLVVYYSRTGITRKVAEEIKNKLNCDIEEIYDTKDRKGTIGYIFSGRDAMKKELTEIKPIAKDPSQYDLVIIGTPIWAWTISNPIRTYITQNKDKLKNVSFFCTSGGTDASKVIEEMEGLCDKKSIAKMGLTTKKVVKEMYKEKLNGFIK